MMNVTEVMQIARKHVGNSAAMESSARLCLADAVKAYDNGDLDTARARALRSLCYSIGILAPDFRRASK